MSDSFSTLKVTQSGSQDLEQAWGSKSSALIEKTLQSMIAFQGVLWSFCSYHSQKQKQLLLPVRKDTLNVGNSAAT